MRQNIKVYTEHVANLDFIQVKFSFCFKIGGMPQTETESTAVCGIPILFEIKLRAYRYRVFCSGRRMIENCPKLSCFTAGKRFMLFKGPGSLKES